MSIAKASIQHKVATILASILICVFGLMFATQLQMALMPEMEMPMAVVACYYTGASPSDMEELVTRPLEGAIMSVPGVDTISSTSSDGVSQIQITYVDGTDLDIAATKLREQFGMVSLPEDAMDPVIINMNLSALMPTAMIALVGEDLSQLQTLAEDLVVPALERINGVAQVTVNGGVSQQIAVELDPTRAAGYGLSASYVSQFLAGQNLIYPGGSLENGSKKFTVSTDAKFQTVDDVANMILSLPTGGAVRLSEVANVKLENKDMDAMAKSGEAACVVLQVSKQSAANEVYVSEQVVKRLENLKTENPSLRYSAPYLASDYINQTVDAAYQNILQGVLLAAVVVLLFLRRGGATLTIAVSMPICILTVFVLMRAFNLTLNMMSLGGIAMGVGMIVDNSIVVLENIYRFSADGHSRADACIEGTREVTSSVVASTLTTEAVFVPLALTGGMAGMMFKDFCLTIASLIFASLVISLTLVPLLCYFTLDEEKVRRRQEKRAGKEPGLLRRFEERAAALYLKTLNYFVHHLFLGMAASFALVVLFSITLVNTKMVLMPDMDQGTVNLSISMPIGSQLNETSVIADRVTAIAEAEVPEIEEMFYIASNESVTMMMDIGSKSQRQRSSNDIAQALRAATRDIAGCEITVSASDASAMMGGGGDIAVNIEGDDYDTLEFLANDLITQIEKLPDAVNVTSSLSDEVPQVKVTVNREAAAQYGLTAASIGAAVRSELTGSTATKVTVNSRELDVVVRGSGAAAKSLDALKSMGVPSAMGGTVPLGSVATVAIEQAPQTIVRSNQTRQVTISGDSVSGDTATMTMAIWEILNNYTFPQGYAVETDGSYESMMESFGDLLIALAAALLLVYFVLAVQFESFLMPVMVMLILPVAFTGSLFGLPLTGRDLSMLSLVSIIMLAGTVVNSSIILVEYIKIRRARGEDRETAILHACPLRVRPILMTTLTTILAMVPMAMGIGETNEMMSDMGITMIAGMVISTIVTLVFTPIFYSVIDNLSHVFRRKNKGEKPPRKPLFRRKGKDASALGEAEPLKASQAEAPEAGKAPVEV
ncbi:MAG: efflux RND transporter permease subunit [Oscillibacter sp.]|nr:efflux RND transporter permease subunit [Oscillibacter sp.]